MITVEKLIETARSYLGVPYRHQGRTRKGVDCLGLVIACANDLKVPIADSTAYSTKVDTENLLNGILAHAQQTEKIVVKPGYLALMQFVKEAGATHTALITERGIIHSYNKRGKVVEHRLNDVWEKRIVATFKLNGVTYEQQ